MTTITKYINNPRITDYSLALSKQIYGNKQLLKTELLALYNYHINLSIGPKALYPMSNWQSHRLCLLSSIAVTLDNPTLIQQCHRLCLEWIRTSDCKCCTAKSQDFHWRDSCEYKVYGWWALCQAMVYLQPKTRFAYRPLFREYFAWLKRYEDGLVHIEYLRSNVASDVKKPRYGLKFDPSYNKVLMVPYNQLTS
jgi:hypothetical protein